MDFLNKDPESRDIQLQLLKPKSQALQSHVHEKTKLDGVCKQKALRKMPEDGDMDFDGWRIE